MKKLFVCVMASLCSAFAFAQTDEIAMEDVNLSSGGTETLYVKFKNPTKYTAFQFDLTLPKGVSVAEIGIGGDVPSTREKEFALINKETNTYRFLSYDMENAKLGENASLKISLLASEDATTGVAETSETLLVDPEGESTNLGTDVASITIVDDSPEIIEFGDGGKLAMVSTKNLDFSNREDVKAYIATGYDQMTSEIWLTRVTDVPAGTPIWVSGPKGEKKEILVGTPVTYYPENLLVGSATEDITVPASDDNFINMTLSPKSGKTAVVQSAITGFAAGKAYLHLPKNVTSLVGSDADVTLNAFGKLAYVSKSDLNFANVEGLKAYIATGYAKDGTIWMTRVMKASVNTPLYLKGDKNGSYTIPAAEAKMVYVNMLKGDANNTSDVKAVDGEFTSCVLSKSTGEFGPIGKDNSAFPAGTAYLPLPTAYMKSATRGNGVFEFSESEAEVICVKLFGDGETTGINKVAGEDVDSEKWYNLNGQRIDAPVRKGLYIRNGKKVIVR